MTDKTRIGVNHISLTQLVHDDDLSGSLGLYRYDRTGYHAGAIWFKNNPNERAELKEAAEEHRRRGLEVRITNGGDNLVFHADGGNVIYPDNAEDFWNRIEHNRLSARTKSR